MKCESQIHKNRSIFWRFVYLASHAQICSLAPSSLVPFHELVSRALTQDQRESSVVSSGSALQFTLTWLIFKTRTALARRRKSNDGAVLTLNTRMRYRHNEGLRKRHLLPFLLTFSSMRCLVCREHIWRSATNNPFCAWERHKELSFWQNDNFNYNTCFLCVLWSA